MANAPVFISLIFDFLTYHTDDKLASGLQPDDIVGVFNVTVAFSFLCDVYVFFGPC